MSKRYKTFEQLNGKTLKEGDTVVFNTSIGAYELIVRSWYLSGDHKDQPGSTKFATMTGLTPQGAVRIGVDTMANLNFGFEHFERATALCLTFYAILEGCSSVTIQMNGRSEITLREGIDYRLVPAFLFGTYVGFIESNFLKVGCTSVRYSTLQEIVDTLRELGKIK